MSKTFFFMPNQNCFPIGSAMWCCRSHIQCSETGPKFVCVCVCERERERERERGGGDQNRHRGNWKGL